LHFGIAVQATAGADPLLNTNEQNLLKSAAATLSAEKIRSVNPVVLIRARRAALRGRKFNPDRRVIARLFPEPNVPVDACGCKAAGKRSTHRQVIDANAGIAGHGVPKIFPECIADSGSAPRRSSLAREIGLPHFTVREQWAVYLG
jgi:hypothetical protein